MRNLGEHQVDFEPVGVRFRAASGETLLAAAQQAGVMLIATCGGDGVCGRCIVQVMSGQVSRPNQTEIETLGSPAVNTGMRLACQVSILGDVRVHIPPESMLSAQRTQTESLEQRVLLEPAVSRLELPLAAGEDPLVGLTRVVGKGQNLNPQVQADLQHLSAQAATSASLVVRHGEVLAVRPAPTPLLGLAVDLGTTKLAAYLVDLTNGNTLASRGAMNPQIAYGEDVMARLSHAMQHEDGAAELRIAVTRAIQGLAEALCLEAGCAVSDIFDAVVVGNTAMHHLFLGAPVKQLGLAPYLPAITEAVNLPAHEQGLGLAPGAEIHLLPNIAGFVGADHTAMLLGSGILEYPGVVLGMDIGTNTEISLIAHGEHLACSTASGPAFEGAHIKAGMRAAPGAIEKVVLHEDKLLMQTIGGIEPVGLCGSGILDLVAQLRIHNIVDERGAFKALNDPRVRKGSGGYEFVLTDGVCFDRRDINEIQLAKAAMRTGVNILLSKAGICEDDIDRVIIAGAFGTYLDVQSGIAIGMFPRLPRQRFVQVGNAAGAGARMALLSLQKRAQAQEIARRVHYVELTGEKDFSARFAKALLLR